MNHLEKLCALLTKEGRQIKYGVLTDETADGLIALRYGESEATANFLGDSGRVAYPAVQLCVYHSEYLAGCNLLGELKSEIAGAAKETVYILHTRDRECRYDEQHGKYELCSVYKIIEI